MPLILGKKNLSPFKREFIIRQDLRDAKEVVKEGVSDVKNKIISSMMIWSSQTRLEGWLVITIRYIVF